MFFMAFDSGALRFCMFPIRVRMLLVLIRPRCSSAGIRCVKAAFSLKLFWNTKLFIRVSIWSLKFDPWGISSMNRFRKICSLLQTLSRLPIEVSDSS